MLPILFVVIVVVKNILPARLKRVGRGGLLFGVFLILYIIKKSPETFNQTPDDLIAVIRRFVDYSSDMCSAFTDRGEVLL